MTKKWSQRIATLPDDGLPVIIEEMCRLPTIHQNNNEITSLIDS